MRKLVFNCLLFMFLINGCVQNNAGLSSSHNLTPHNSSVTEPSFPGGMEAFGKFLSKNLKWPIKGDIDVQGMVIISFYIETNGNLSNFKVEKKLWPECDDEALRVLKLSPKWIPAMQKGKAIRKKYLVPINFTISE